MKPDTKVLSAIGLAMRAGKIKSGSFQAEEAIKKNTAALVLIARDASENTKKHFRDLCSYRNIPALELSDKETLGKCIGKEERSALCVTDASFGDMIQKEICKLTEVTNP